MPLEVLRVCICAIIGCPDPPTNITLSVSSSSSLHVKFGEPLNRNGAVVTKYKGKYFVCLMLHCKVQKLLAVYSIDTHFDASTIDSCENTVGNEELLVMSNFFFSHNVFYSIRKLYPLFVSIISLFAAELEEPKIGM